MQRERYSENHYRKDARALAEMFLDYEFYSTNHGFHKSEIVIKSKNFSQQGILAFKKEDIKQKK
jgi:hypothetical protein